MGTTAWAALLIVSVVLGGCSSNQQPEAGFRRETTPFQTTRWRCWPLPSETLPDFPVIAQNAAQRGEGDSRRLRMTFQFFNVDPADARLKLIHAMTSGGFGPRSAGSDEILIHERAIGTTRISVVPFVTSTEEVPVRGEIILDLPGAAIARASSGTCPRPGRPLGA